MPPLIDKLRPWLEPAVGAAFLALWIQAEVGRLHSVGDLATLVYFSAAIALSRVLPFLSVVYLVGILVFELIGILPPPGSTTWPVYGASLIVIFFAAQRARRPFQWVALALGGPIAVLSAYLMVIPDSVSPSKFLSWTSTGQDSPMRVTGAFFVIAAVAAGLYAGAWAAGIALRLNGKQLYTKLLHRTTAAELGVAEVELLIARDRDRIAREVHDVLAHSLSVVIAQADGARFATDGGSGGAREEKTDAALRAISDAARSSLIDVRTLIEALREEPGNEPQPSLADLDALLERVRDAGVNISVAHFGEQKAMTPAQELAVFRIVQECLTNSLRHAGRRSNTRISFDWRGPGLSLTITTHDGEDADAPAAQATGDDPARGGHGIRGMKDRARLAGGWLTAGKSGEPGGDFLVTVFIPTGTGDSGEAGLASDSGVLTAERPLR